VNRTTSTRFILGKSTRSQALAILLGALLFAPAADSAQVKTDAPIEFVDVTQSAGIKFVHFKGNKGISINLEEFGPGLCVSDFDRDGWQDIYFVNARNRYDRGITVKNALYRNNGDGTFTDVTDAAGVPAQALDWAASGETMIMTASPISSSRNTAAMCFITTMVTAPSPM
jgi:FG-GAP-like repeat